MADNEDFYTNNEPFDCSAGITRYEEDQARTAFENLSGFMSLLVEINEREQIVPTKGNRENDDR